jgi:replication-associated recombination protein RarA
MLSSVLKSKRAVQMNILIVRAFVKLREMISNNKDLANRMEKVETTQKKHASVIGILVDEIHKMKKLPPEKPKEPIGFVTK